MRRGFHAGVRTRHCDALWPKDSLLLSACFLLCALGCGTVQPSPQPYHKIQHVVVIFQENRTPDNLFHGLPNADIAESGLNSKGRRIVLTPIPLAAHYGPDHTHQAFVQMYRRGRMDGADKIGVSCLPAKCTGSNLVFAYVDPLEVKPYFDLAEQYTFADRMFQTNQGPSFPAHQFIIAGTSAPSATSHLFAAENPGYPIGYSGPNAFYNAGCMAPVGEAVFLIDPLGREHFTQYPCFEHRTLPDLLDDANISWRYYTPSAGLIWTGPNAIRHLRFGPDWSNVTMPQTKILTDIQVRDLPSVSWVIPSGQASDHPQATDGSGPSWVAAIVNAIGESPYWSSTAIFITWDDWGGWYDHVAPPIYNSYEYGFRVPLIVVSPYSKPHYVSHATHDFGSILKFIENDFDLPSLGFADSRADDLSDCFDFSKPPLRFHVIAAPLPAEHFLEDTTPPADPDDD